MCFVSNLLLSYLLFFAIVIDIDRAAVFGVTHGNVIIGDTLPKGRSPFACRMQSPTYFAEVYFSLICVRGIALDELYRW
jgi:hypothetical protein